MTFLDLFSGIGGFRLGMEMAGHTCKGHCEIDRFAEKSYRIMHDVKEDEWFAEDITRIRADELPSTDCWCFGFPCQDISIAGKRKGIHGSRSSLFFAITSLIRDLSEKDKPKTLFIENVKNLLSINGGFDFLRLLIELDEIGYDAEWQVLNSKHYGVPQSRERIYIVGHLRGKSGRQVFPLRGADGKDIIQIKGGSQGERIYSPDGVGVTLRSNGGGMGAKTGLYFIDMNPGGTRTDEARCLTARYHKGMTKRRGELSGILANGRVRRLTPKECFRLQGFPDEYFERARMVNSDTQLYKQAGNSVTVPVVYEIAKRL